MLTTRLRLWTPVLLAAVAVVTLTSDAATPGQEPSALTQYMLYQLPGMAFAVSPTGTVVGQPGERGSVYIWERGRVSDPGWGWRHVPVAINGNGDILVLRTERTPPFQTRTLIWSKQQFRDLGFVGGGPAGTAYGTRGADLNDNGEVVGVLTYQIPSADPDGNAIWVEHPFYWKDGVFTELEGEFKPNPITPISTAINSHGQVIVCFNSYSRQGYLWEQGTRTVFPTLRPFAINDSGSVVGASFPASQDKYANAALWSNGRVQPLGSLLGAPPDESHYSIAEDINNHGAIVGWSVFDNTGQSHAVLWRGGAITDLNTLLPAGGGWELTHATGIADSGHIIGSGFLNKRRSYWVLVPSRR